VVVGYASYYGVQPLPVHPRRAERVVPGGLTIGNIAIWSRLDYCVAAELN